jgi:hypothetical protein
MSYEEKFRKIEEKRQKNRKKTNSNISRIKENMFKFTQTIEYIIKEIQSNKT